jgi:hypothetical protein
MATCATSDASAIYVAFKQDVNMTAAELSTWLKTDEAKAVGWDSSAASSIGHLATFPPWPGGRCIRS